MTANTTQTGAETSAAQTIWLILAESGVNQFRSCILGEGTTEKDAWESAYGPEGKRARPRRSRVWASQVNEEEYGQLCDARDGA